MDQGSVNGQIVDSVADVVTLNNGIAPTQAFGMLDSVMTETLGMAMYNAVSRQQGSSMIGSAATTAVCAKMLSAPFPFEMPPSPPPPPPPPAGGIQPLDPPPPKPPRAAAAAIIAAAKAEGESAIDALKAEEAGLATSAAAARDALEQLTAEAAPTVAAALAAGATAEAEAGIAFLQKVANDPSDAGQKDAQTQLAVLAAAAKNAPPPPPPPGMDPAEAGKAATQAIAILQQLAAGAPDPADSANARATLDRLGIGATFTPPKK
jgi:hypothetical protein